MMLCIRRLRIARGMRDAAITDPASLQICRSTQTLGHVFRVTVFAPEGSAVLGI